ncbi:DMT family transporter [Candidatus Roizmanbacteria bacterium]|nr:DMT family transporter [Candidatus Roizmanbacteria bacterium]
MKNLKQIHKGIIFAFLTAIISGFAIFYSKISVAKIDPLILATTRNSLVGIFFIIYFLATNNVKQLLKFTKKELLLLFGIGIIGGSIPFYLFFTGIKLIGAQSANIIHKSLFIWVAILSVFLLKEKVSVKYIIAGFLVFTGTYFFTPFKLMFGRGEQLILIATLFWSLENILAKKVLNNTSSELVGLFRMVLGGGVLLIITLLSGKGKLLTGLNVLQWHTIIIGGSILFFYVFTWYKALKYAPASVVALILTFSLVVGNILNGSFAHITLQRNDWYTMVFITVAMGILTQRLFVRSHE